MHRKSILLCLTCQLISSAYLVEEQAASQEPKVSFERRDDRLVLKIGESEFAHYVFEDSEILRPYFSNIRLPQRPQATRSHPPMAGDSKDHRTMHPGIWLAFGDINGVDFWRNQGTVKHVEFKQVPTAERNTGSFIEWKRYVAPSGETICEEEFRFALRVQEHSALFVFESHFSGENRFTFGDQEEMGLGIRVATAMTQENGGTLTDSQSREGAKAIWGREAKWCDYSGASAGQGIGTTILVHPSNFRATWFHARKYGLVVANAFGREAMRQGAKSQVSVEPGQALILRYAVLVHSGLDPQAIQRAYREYVKSGGTP